MRVLSYTYQLPVSDQEGGTPRVVPNTCKTYFAKIHHVHHCTTVSCGKRENQSSAAPEALYLDMWHTSNPDNAGKPQQILCAL